MIWESVQDMNEEERVSCVCVCSAVVLKAIYQAVVIMVRGLTGFSVFAAVNHFRLEEFGSTAGCHFLGHRELCPGWCRLLLAQAFCHSL